LSIDRHVRPSDRLHLRPSARRLGKPRRAWPAWRGTDGGLPRWRAGKFDQFPLIVP
jgi:hypothetical protein